MAFGQIAFSKPIRRLGILRQFPLKKRCDKTSRRQVKIRLRNIAFFVQAHRSGFTFALEAFGAKRTYFKNSSNFFQKKIIKNEEQLSLQILPGHHSLVENPNHARGGDDQDLLA
tara:strand:- start:2 stop:343 length:342 start_codon:yes stop_codon:yes gene_type:complete